MSNLMCRTSMAQRAGATLLLLSGIFAFILPLLWPQDPLRQQLMLALQWPGLDAPLGYDHLGRSLFARLTAATR
ncbi:putative ABC transport system, inner membrane component [Erwinia amylovora Ea644]|nr:putative ABC transport system, inner membrane component [Erwinia amylovora Ea644]CCP07624.1 peptide/nickel transport system permease protein [Erwinia amylovora MR1]